MVRLRARPVGGMRNDPCVIPFRLEVTCCRRLCLWWVEIYPPSSVAVATASPRGEAFLTPCKHGKYDFESWGVFTIRPHPSPLATDEGESICFRSSLCCVGCVVRKKSCKRLPLGGKLARKRLMRGDNSAPHKSIFHPERNDTWVVPYNISFPIGNTLCRGATRVSFRPPAHQPCAEPHPAKNPYLPKQQKTSSKSTRTKQSEPNFRIAWAGALGGSSGKMREVWREKDPPPKGGSFSLQGLPFSPTPDCGGSETRE